jgi:hypothetical protein
MKRVSLGLLLALAACSDSKPSDKGGGAGTIDAAGTADVALPPASRIPAGTREVAFNEFSGDVAVCGAGAAHPNICCQASLTEAPACFVAASPFAPCPASWLTYPDATRCCSLDGDNVCVPATVGDGGVDGGGDAGDDGDIDAAIVDSGTDDAGVDAGPIQACYEPCAPGNWLDTDGNCCWGRGTVVQCSMRDRCSGSADACKKILGAHSTACATCPTGWSPTVGQTALCCRTTPAAQCFSQAKTIAIAHLGSGRFCTEAPGKGTCRCEITGDDWRVSVLACDLTANPPCTLAIDGIAATTSSTWCN